MRIIYKISYVRKLCLIICFLACCYFTGRLTKTQVFENGGLGFMDLKTWEDKRCISFSEPVDIVFTWVNGSDPKLIDTMLHYLPEGTELTAKRFRDWGNLRYALRSVEMYADWINHVFIVTNGQVPNWLNTGYHKVSIVKHSDIFRNLSHLPTFNAQAIETHLHRIPGLSKSFLYMNDDFFFAQTVEIEDFYSKETGFKIRFGAERVPEYIDKCNKLTEDLDGIDIIGTQCNNSDCEWDGNKCITAKQSTFALASRYGSFLGSLFYTSITYDRAFGHAQRGVPAHAPYIIDVDVMNSLQDRFPEEWERTSKNRFREPICFQYSFAYYHFLMHSHQQNMCQAEGTQPIATNLYHYTDYAYFATGNSTKLEKILTNFLRKKNKKFVCLNDHMGNKYSDAEIARNGDVMTKFFQEYFPERSKFEIN